LKPRSCQRKLCSSSLLRTQQASPPRTKIRKTSLFLVKKSLYSMRRK